MSQDTLEDFLDSLSRNVRELVSSLRTVVLNIAPDAEETVLWGGISYHTPWIGGRIKGALCQIEAKNGQVKLAFIHGIRLADPDHLLCGTALSKRFVPIQTIAEAQRPEIAALIREASAIELGPPI